MTPAGPSEEERTLGRLVHGYKLSEAVQTFVEIGGPTVLGEGRASLVDLAARTGTETEALHLLVRLLAAADVVVLSDDGHVALTPVGALLQPGASRYAGLSSGPVADRSRAMWARLTDSVRTGAPTFAAVTGQKYYEYLDEHPAAGDPFYERTGRPTRAAFIAVAWAYDFGASLVVDVGGGLGGLLRVVLDFHQQATGILLDRPEVIARLSPTLEAGSSLAERCRLVAGDFFQSVPAGGDVYLLSTIVNNWPDDQVVDLLRTCRRAMPAGARLLLVEELFGGGRSVELALESLQRHLVFGGRMRSKEELAGLLDASGLRLRTVLPTWSTFSVLEATPAED